MKFSGFFSGALSVLIVFCVFIGSFSPLIVSVKKAEALPGVLKKIVGAEGASLASCGATYGASTLWEKLRSKDSVPSKDDASISQFIKNNCLNPAAKAFAMRLVAKMTEATVNWINTGLNGNPFYVQNLRAYVGSVEDEIVRDLVVNLRPDSSPFAENTARALLISYKNQRNEKYIPGFVLDKFINGTWEDFLQKDFYTTGWSGWIAATISPQNNPIGYSFAVADRSYGNLERGRSDTLQELAQNSGFLSFKKCIEKVTNPDGEEVCKTYQTVTPGSAIKSQLDKVFPTPQAPDISKVDDPVQLLFLGIFQTLTNNILQKGFASTTTDNNPPSGSYYGNFTGQGSNNLTTTTSTSQNSGGGWINAGPQTGIILENMSTYKNIQQQYIQKTDTLVQRIDTLIPQIYKADFCLPGPRPDWQETAQQALAEISSQIPDKMWKASSLFNGVLGVNLSGQYIDPLGEIGKENMSQEVRATFQRALVGGNSSPTYTNPTYIFGYKDFINQYYGPQNQIPVAGAIKNEYQEISTHQIIKDDSLKNKDKAFTFSSNIDFITTLVNGLPPTTNQNYANQRAEVQKKANNLLGGMYNQDDVDALDDQIDEYDLRILYLTKPTTGLIAQCEIQSASSSARKPYPVYLLPPGTNYSTQPTFLPQIQIGDGPLNSTIYIEDYFDVISNAQTPFLFEYRLGIY